MAQRKSGYERRPLELYETPQWVTEALLDQVDLSSYDWIWEPAMGSGLMFDVIRNRYPSKLVYGSDIELDFLKLSPDAWKAQCIITNPPFKQAEQFLIQALKMTQEQQGMVAMLLKVDFDSAITRADLFEHNPAWGTKLVLRKRIKWFDDPEIKSGPSENHAWFIFDWKKQVRTMIYGPITEESHGVQDTKNRLQLTDWTCSTAWSR